MGVSGCGKSSLAQALAEALDLPLIEGDDFHPPTNVAKMVAGVPLNDSDRVDWLSTLADQMNACAGGAVLTCSALKHSYRERLRQMVPDLRFVYLEINRDVAQSRVEGRMGAHMFPGSLVDSQFDTLEAPMNEPLVLTLTAMAPLNESVASVRQWLSEPVLPMHSLPQQ